ncbi:MAG: chromosome segregation protein SMC, partial [Verrucomicrobia bacterium]|nr:chromosome segregation protein SMC [Verrucomicrobiota bacterium]
VFEEAAGITKFKSQKKEALRKLEYTDANLLRVADIIAEVSRQMNSLQRQAQKAKRYQVLHKDLRVLDTHLGHRHYTEFQAEKSETDTQIKVLLAQCEEMQKKIHDREADAAQTREAYHQVEGRINSLRQQAQELHSRIQGADSKIGFNNERAEELAGRIQRNQEDANSARELLERQRRELAAADEQFAEIHNALASRQAALDEPHLTHNAIIPERLRIDTARRTLRETFRTIESQMATEEARAQNLSGQMSGDRQRHETLQHDKQAAAQQREASQVEFDHLQRQIQELESSRDDLDQKLKDIASSIQERRLQREGAIEELNEIQRHLTQRNLRLETLHQIIEKGEGLDFGTQNVLGGFDEPERFKDKLNGIVASSIEVDPQFISAIEAALRDHLQAVLLTDSSLAEDIISKLNHGKLGRAALALQDFLHSEEGTERQFMPNGAIAWALDKVKAKQEVQPLMNRLLRDVVIVEDLATALRLKMEHPALCFVTLNGEMISAYGVIHGGAGKEEASSTLRREAESRKLREEAGLLEAAAAVKEEQIEELRVSIEEQSRDEANARDAAQKNRDGLSQFHGKVSVVQRALQQATAKLDSLEWEQNQIGDRLATAEAAITGHRDAAAACNRQLEENQLREQELDRELENIIRRESESTERLNELKTAFAVEQNALQSVERQKAPLASRLEELQNSITRYENEVFTWEQRIESAQNENRHLEEALEDARRQHSVVEEEGAMLVDNRNAAFEKVTVLENELNAFRQRYNELNEHRNRAEVQQTRVDLRLENLVTQVHDRYQISLDTFEPDPHTLLLALNEQKKQHERNSKRKATLAARTDGSTDGSETAAEDDSADTQQVQSATDEADSAIDGLDDQPDWDLVLEIVTELRQRLEGMGPVNLDAIQEFEELEERHNFLATQHGDLIKSKEELLQVIAKINETTKTMFSETFAAVRANFRQNFKELFGQGSQADLRLENEEDPLESGIEIEAKPPGKKLQTISLLSGGERSMTAVALLFSIYMVKPSPFCVLDELDAPLDESNIGRFILMLDKFINNSQFIIVTNSKRTMSRADVIYGVTMQEFGISKPVGVRMTNEKASLEDGAPNVAETVRGPGKRRAEVDIDALI